MIQLLAVSSKKVANLAVTQYKTVRIIISKAEGKDTALVAEIKLLVSENSQ